MSLYVAEFRMRKRPGLREKPTAWKPALGMWMPTRYKYRLARDVESEGAHDNCEYRVVRYVRAPKRRAR